MDIHEAGIYHIYNRGNNRQRIFFTNENYHYFLRKCQQYLNPASEIFAWCLMPKHFHFLLEIEEKGLKAVRSGGILMPAITNGFRLLQSAYAKGINIQQKRSGNLFQQKTKAKLVSGKENYGLTAFRYIHQNPVNAGMVRAAQDWPFSSFTEYAGIGSINLCNRDRCLELLGLTPNEAKTGVDRMLDDEETRDIF